MKAGGFADSRTFSSLSWQKLSCLKCHIETGSSSMWTFVGFQKDRVRDLCLFFHGAAFVNCNGCLQKS